MIKPFTLKNQIVQLSVLLSFFSFPLFSSAQWVAQPNGFKPRSEVNSVLYQGKVYAFFGFRTSGLTEVEPSAEVYDPETNTWTLLDSMPADKAMTHAAAVVVDDMVWHIGGRVGKHPGPLTDETWIYKITENKWVPGPKLTDPATGDPILWAAGGAALLGRTLHVFGGFIVNACNHDQDSYHLTLDVDEWLADPSQPAKWKNVSAPLPVKRNHFSTVVLGGKIYAIGGQFDHDCNGAKEQSYAHVYDQSTDTWTALPPLPDPRSHTEGSSFAIDGKIYIVGGQSTRANSDKVTIFDPEANNGAGAWEDNDTFTLPDLYETLSAKVVGNTFVISHGGQPRYNYPSVATYTRTISRTPVYKLGFYPACSTLQVPTGQDSTIRTLLFTIDGSKDFTTSSNVPWLSVTKNASGTAVQNAVDVEIAVNANGLAPGIYYGKITATGTGTGPLYAATEYCVNLTVSASSTSSGRLEAEEASLNGAVVAKNHPHYTGSGFVDYLNSTGDYIEWAVTKADAGNASLKFRYSNGSGRDRPLRVEVNGSVIEDSLSFPPTRGWNEWSTVSITANLNKGENKIRLTAIGFSGANIDHLAWSEVAAEGITTFRNVRGNELKVANTLLQVSIAPNPANGIAKIRWSRASEAPVEISVADALGNVRKTFLVKNGSSGQFDLSVQGLPSGLYLVLIRQGKEKQSAKLFVSNH